MSTFTPNGGARSGLRHLVSGLRARLAGFVAFARAWRWGAVLGRVVLAALGLVLLGAIGHSAFARNMLVADTMLHVDAGADVAPPPPPLTPTSLALAAAPAVATSAEPTAPGETTALPAIPLPVASAQSARGRATADDPVYLNQATLSDLHRLPGVGPKRAEAILALRTKLGHFRQVEDLLKVKGIGRSSLRKLRPLVRLDAPPAGSADAATPPPL